MNLRSVISGLGEQFDRRQWLVIPIGLVVGLVLGLFLRAALHADTLRHRRELDDDQVDDDTPPPAPRRRKAKAPRANAPQDVPPAPAGDEVPT